MKELEEESGSRPAFYTIENHRMSNVDAMKLL